MFEQLTKTDNDVYLGVFEELVKDFEWDTEFVWDTSLPELDEPWPHHAPEDLDLRGMLAWLTGRPDVTGYLYEAHQLAEYERTLMVPWGGDVTALMDAVA
jgi:hypothetical protein